MINAAIMGPKLSGKTYLAKTISRQYWQQRRMRSFVLDPHLEEWGSQALVFGSDNPEEQEAEEERFWQTVWKTTDSLIIVEEAATTIRRERGLIPIFTRLRHRRHRLIVVGHSGIDLLPVMRQQIDTLYLFRQPSKAAQIWVENFAEEELMGATELGQYEFLLKEAYKPVKRMKLPPPSARSR